LKVLPTAGSGFRGFAVFDLDRGAFDRWDAEAWVEPVPRVRFSAGTHNVAGTVHSAVARAAVRFDERWAAEFEEQYDFERGRQVSASLKVRRTLHRWVLELGFHADRTREDVGVSLTFMPLLAAPEGWW
jgi:hypothetical protein